jgi:hypothetical protein
MEGLRKLIIIKTNSHEEEYEVCKKIHEQLVGNQDYIDCNIVLNMSSDRVDETENEVHLYIFDDAKANPEIKI